MEDLKVMAEDRFSHYFTSEALEAMKTQFREAVFPKPERKTLFLACCSISKEGIEKAARAIAMEVNILTNLGKVLGVLAPLSTLPLVQSWAKDGRYAGYRDPNGVDHFGSSYFVSEEKPEGATLQPQQTVVFCFITVPYDFTPCPYMGLNMDLYCQEGEIGKLLFQ